MTSVDLVVLGVLALSGLIAFMRGIVREILSIAGWVGAALVATTFVSYLRPFVGRYMPSPEWTDPVSYIALFLVSLIVFSILAKMVSNAVRSSAVGGIDRSLGLVFGLARGAVVAIVVYVVGGMAMPPDHWPEQVIEARSLPFIHDGAIWITQMIPEEYRPKIPPLPAARQTSAEGVMTPTPTGRAIDPPIRR
ncbi:MAG: CvpA family protein [Acetobacteraceae bacterium]|nr:CvpA family protein [Acetobacteraceae bacterium]